MSLQRLRERQRAANAVNFEASPGTPSPTSAIAEESGTEYVGQSFQPVDLQPYLDGEVERPEPTLLRMTNGKGLFYPGRVNSVHGDSGAGKSWLIPFVLHQASRLPTPERHMVIDLEDNPMPLIERCGQLGLTGDSLKSVLTFLHPTEPMMDPRWDAVLHGIIEPALAAGVKHVWLDTLGEALSNDGANEDKDEDVTPWMRYVARRIAEAGLTFIMIDHSTKANPLPLHPSGSKRKRAALTGAAYWMRPIQNFTRGAGGVARLRSAKDRHGWYEQGADVADLAMKPPTNSDGSVRLDDEGNVEGLYALNLYPVHAKDEPDIEDRLHGEVVVVWQVLSRLEGQRESKAALERRMAGQLTQKATRDALARGAEAGYFIEVKGGPGKPNWIELGNDPSRPPERKAPGLFEQHST